MATNITDFLRDNDIAIQQAKAFVMLLDTLMPPNAQPKAETFDRELRAAIKLMAIEGEGYGIDEMKTWPEWKRLRAIFFLHCGGFEDAMHPRRGQIAALISGPADEAELGRVVMQAWTEYADSYLEEKVSKARRDLDEERGAGQQASALGYED